MKRRALKGRRDNPGVRTALAEVRGRAQSKENMMPAILDAVRVYATLGEISNVLRDEWGEYRE